VRLPDQAYARRGEDGTEALEAQLPPIRGSLTPEAVDALENAVLGASARRQREAAHRRRDADDTGGEVGAMN
jgi:hypothetical protein